MSISIPKEAVFDEGNPRDFSYFLRQMKTLFNEAAPNATNEKKNTFSRLEKSITIATCNEALNLKEQGDAEFYQMREKLATTKHKIEEVGKTVAVMEKSISLKKDAIDKMHLDLVQLEQARRLMNEECKEKMEKHEKEKSEMLLKNNKLELKWAYEEAREQLQFELEMTKLQEEKHMLELDIAFSKLSD